MTVWKLLLIHPNDTDTPIYIVSPYNLEGSLKYFGIKWLKNCYLCKNKAERKAEMLNRHIQYRAQLDYLLSENYNREHKH